MVDGRPMLEYKSGAALYEFLNVPNFPRMHWSKNSGWIMADFMYVEVRNAISRVLVSANYVTLTCAEVSTIDNGSWISIHAYVVQNWSRVPYLISLEKVVEGPGSDNLVHCMAHRCNLAFKTLSQLDIMSHIEGLLKNSHAYFKHSPKRHLEFVKLADVMETKGLKLLKNVKTRWVSLIEPLRSVIQEFRVLLAKMKVESDSKEKSAQIKYLPSCVFLKVFFNACSEFKLYVCEFRL
jgi:hypothetical protein